MCLYMDVSKNRGFSPKLDGENNGKPDFLMDDLGVPLVSETPIYWIGSGNSQRIDGIATHIPRIGLVRGIPFQIGHTWIFEGYIC